MSHRMRIASAALGLVTALALAGCGGGTTPGTGAATGGTTSSSTLHLAFLDAISTPDPDTAYDGSELNLVNSAYEGLLTYQAGNSDATLVGALATDWSANKANTVFSFTLRKGVTFHDGTRFTSAAVEASFQRRTKVDGGPAYMVADVKSVATPSPTKVVITLTHPNSSFLDLLASPFGPKMISPTALKAHPWTGESNDWFATHDAGTGPYEYADFTPGTSYDLKAYADYWGTAPGYRTVHFDVVSSMSTIQLELEKGQLDGLVGYTDSAAFSSFQKDSGLKTYTFPSMQTPTLFVNPNSATLGAASTRLSFLAGIDFAALTKAALGDTAEATDQVFPVNLLPAAVNKQRITHDGDALSRLASGALKGQTITCGYPASSPASQALCDNLVATLNAAGIAGKSVGYSSGTYYSGLGKGAHPADITFFTGFPDTAAPDAWGHVFYSPSGGLDLFGATVPGLDAILDKAAENGDTKLYGRAASMVSKSGWWYSVATSLNTAVFSPTVAGVEQSWEPVITGVLQLQYLHPAS
ncbi:MAG: ABC transporter substrate-binding protein [Nocardioides sp.]|uniref:ABC transporter substrate-binding protein n=1 Tax=Nocardioides sp. TaxID=35761 RepID=UPI0039E22991